MSTHTAIVEWHSNGSRFTDNRYSRAHQWRFDGGAVVPASSSPHVVRVPLSDPAGVDPEEAYVAALSSCHMLWFLSIAADAGLAVDSYRDEASGVMAKNEAGNEWIARVVLRPHVVVRGETPVDRAALDALHHRAHEACFLANSVKTDVVVEGTVSVGG
ncbi:MAG TPA: OsmC family protein [Paraburkholderia sp.]|jgi:organic hydroperoxide reductase OsmC/OhrA|nr:OsmC family protein [Paraburkholderia sp.]